jgi:ribonucleoside-diphosphate reductase alpha chain
VAQYLREHNLTDESQLPDWFVTSAEIAPVDRVQMQAAWQAHIDASISSTVNLPNEATVEDVKEIYMAAWKDGLKGITVFRDGCKRTGVLTTGKKEQTEPPVTAAEIATGSTSHPPLLIDPDMIRRGLMRGEIVECSDNLVGKKRKLTTGCGSLHVLAYFDKETGDMMEVYLAKGSTGGCANFMTGLSRTISLLCRAGVSVYDIKDQLDSTGSCPSYATRSATKHDTSKGACCPMAIGNALIEMYEEMHRETIRTAVVTAETEIERTTNTTLANETPYVDGLQCPECGATLRHEGGCDLCEFCGWSHCG